ncbi:hypothetical protein [Flavobacterium sp. MDT1-60]|uniref:hypothetical protein n=1 Tax=Flavobacterium sp. MDT1-60 TaxID=1979344 RepID=UPI00177DAAF6|nr:hypothetical protein [Flavobacterium sp. MDT1-60]QOG01175.1 hypothetical protein IHE43_15290 [Flavobacterium sp. MDT1-60]
MTNNNYPLLAQTPTFMVDGTLEIKPSSNSNSSDYSFLIGNHKVHHRKLKERFNNCKEWVDIEGSKTTELLLTGISNIEKHYMCDSKQQPIEAFALRLFNPVTKLWSLYWADSIFGILDPPLLGSFENNIGLFFGKEIINGKEIIVQFQYDRTDTDNPVWGQAFSNDNGKTWEWNWFMFFSRIKIKL